MAIDTYIGKCWCEKGLEINVDRLTRFVLTHVAPTNRSTNSQLLYTGVGGGRALIIRRLGRTREARPSVLSITMAYYFKKRRKHL